MFETLDLNELIINVEFTIMKSSLVEKQFRNFTLEYTRSVRCIFIIYSSILIVAWDFDEPNVIRTHARQGKEKREEPGLNRNRSADIKVYYKRGKRDKLREGAELEMKNSVTMGLKHGRYCARSSSGKFWRESSSKAREPFLFCIFCSLCYLLHLIVLLSFFFSLFLLLNPMYL